MGIYFLLAGATIQPRSGLERTVITKQLLNNGKVTQIVVAALLVIITVLATLLVSASSGNNKYVLRVEYNQLIDQYKILAETNRDEHKEIRAIQMRILEELGGIRKQCNQTNRSG